MIEQDDDLPNVRADYSFQPFENFPPPSAMAAVNDASTIKLSMFGKLLRGEQLSKVEKSLFKAVSVIGLGGLVLGYDAGVIAGGLEQLQNNYQLTTLQSALIVSVMSLGAAFGSLFGGAISDSLGRWRASQLQSILLIIGSLLISTSTNVLTIIVARFIIGIGTAVASVAAVPYLNEISSPKYRGRFQGAYELFISIGIFISNAVNLFSYTHSRSWRVVFSMPIIIAVVQSCGMFFLPESPSFLVQKGRIEEARVALEAIYCDPEVVDAQLNTLQIANLTKIDGRFNSFFRFLRIFLASLVMIIILCFFQAFSGGLLFSVYGPFIFGDGGYSINYSLLYTLVLGFVRILFTVLAMFRVDSRFWGRRKLLTRGIGAMVVGHIGLACAYFLNMNVSSLRSVSQYLLPPFCAIIVAGYAIGYSPITRILQSEVFPTIIRSRGTSVTIFFQSLFMFVVNFSFLPLTSSIGPSVMFLIYAVLTAVGLLFVVKCVPETLSKDPMAILSDVKASMASFPGAVFCKRCCTMCWPSAGLASSSKSDAGAGGDINQNPFLNYNDHSIVSNADADRVLQNNYQFNHSRSIPNYDAKELKMGSDSDLDDASAYDAYLEAGPGTGDDYSSGLGSGKNAQSRSVFSTEPSSSNSKSQRSPKQAAAPARWTGASSVFNRTGGYRGMNNDDDEHDGSIN